MMVQSLHEISTKALMQRIADELEGLIVADAEGRYVADASIPVTIEVSGPGVLLGLENGDLADNTPYSSPSRKTKEGKLLAYIRRTGPEAVTVTAKAEGLPAVSLTLEANR